MADTHLQIMRQESIEARYNRKLIDGYIKGYLDIDPKAQNMISKGVQLLEDWLAKAYYPSKDARLAQLKQFDLPELVAKLMLGSCYYQTPTLFTSVTSQLAGRLGFDDKRDAILTMAEMLAVLAHTDAFDIGKAEPMGSMLFVSRIALTPELIKFIEQSMYLPPMVCVPLELRNNYDSGYLSHKESVLLGSKNHHNGNVCLDAINLVNSVALSLNIDFMREVEEEPTREFTIEKAKEAAAKKGKVINDAQARLVVAQQMEHWHQFKPISNEVYMTLIECGNEFYLTNRYDKRGRMYAQGYHVNSQGTSFKKACLELAKKEAVQGVPCVS